MCHGYNTTSPAESMNNMLKHSLNNKNITWFVERARPKPIYEISQVVAKMGQKKKKKKKKKKN